MKGKAEFVYAGPIDIKPLLRWGQYEYEYSPAGAPGKFRVWSGRTAENFVEFTWKQFDEYFKILVPHT